MLKYKVLLDPYNPWWTNSEDTFVKLPAFHRPLFYTLLGDLNRIPQMLSIMGPRRIGKSTLLHQLIEALLKQGVSPQRLIYYSFDDPALLRHGAQGGELLDDLMNHLARSENPGNAYLFLDEVQRFDRWELYLKKYYDLRFPIRIVISGSASSPIFKKSRESLIGRVKDYPLLPFSFREYVLYQCRGDASLTHEVDAVYQQGAMAQGLLTGDPHVHGTQVKLSRPSQAFEGRIKMALEHYLLEGGFPEVWDLPDWIAKQEYLFDNQVKKVIYEDLMLAQEFHKPELLKRFYISLLEAPGRETSIQAMAGETGTSAQQIEKYLPLLEMTNLVYRIEKFRKSPLRVRRGKMKFYLVDLALRNAVLRLTDTLLQDDQALGFYAENLVFLALKKWRGAIHVDYYREKVGEVDFVVHVGPGAYVPIEVKYRTSVAPTDWQGIRHFCRRYAKRATPLIVTKSWEQFGRLEDAVLIPLPLFLLLFD